MEVKNVLDRKTQGIAKIDKLCLTELDSRIVDEAKLRANAREIRKANGQLGYSIIGDEFFGKYDFNIRNRGFLKDGSRDRLQTHVIGKEYGNLICDTVEEVRERLNIVKERLLLKYGIEISYDNARITEVEINKTLLLEDKEFEKYQRVLVLLMSLIPEKMQLNKFQLNGSQKYVDEISSYMDIQTLYRRNLEKNIEVKFYDKSTELKEINGIQIEDNVLRFEITLSGKKVSCLRLNNDLLNDLTDIKINDYMNRIGNVFFSVPYYKWEDIRIEEIAKIFIEEYKENSTHFIRNTLNRIVNLEDKGVPYILDQSQIKRALLKADLYNDNAQKNLYRLCKNTFNRFKEDKKRVEEIMEKLT